MADSLCKFRAPEQSSEELTVLPHEMSAPEGEENTKSRISCEHSYASRIPPLVMQSSNLPSDELDIDHGGGGIETTKLICKELFLKKEVNTKKSLPDLPPVMQLSNLRSDGLDIEHGGGGIRTTELCSIESPSEAVADASKNLPELNTVVQSSSLSSALNLKPVEVESSLFDCKQLVSKIKDDVIANISDNSLSVTGSSNLSSEKLDTKHGSSTEATEFNCTKLLKRERDEDLCFDEQHSKLSKTEENVSEDDFLMAIKKDDEREPLAKKQKLDDCSDYHVKISCANASEDGNEDNESKCKFLISNVNKSKLSELDSTDKAESQNGSSNGLMEFDILDEFESNDNDPDDVETDDSDISLDEIDAMLDAGLLNGKTSTGKPLEHEVKEKVILKVRGRNHFDVLPEGWIEVTHNSGMPIYLHKQTRVCAISKPYFLGPGSTRKHEVPLSAIPCLHYLKELEKEKEEEESVVKNEPDNGEKDTEEKDTGEKDTGEKDTGEEGIGEKSVGEKSVGEKGIGEKSVGAKGIGENSVGDKNIFPSAKLESVKDNKRSGSLDYLALREYCEKRFQFQTITVKRFKTWSGRRRHQKLLKLKQRPSLPDSTKLITCPLPNAPDKCVTLGNATKREFIMNPSGKSPVCILHEYVQHTLRVQPKYIFKELENASTPYGAVVIINDMEYGSGYGSSKKQAKSEAAKAALEILIPKMKMFTSEVQTDELQDVEFFDEVRVEDPRVCDLSIKAGQPYPYQVLLECLKRNYGMGDTEIEFTMRNLKHQKNEFVMVVGKHCVAVVCKNKRDGKHRASQAILQLLHPHINSWGSLLRMYGKGSCKTLKEKKVEEQRITELQSQACANRPNVSILNKLKEEMLKYSEKMKSKKPIGKLIPERMEFLSTSDSNLKNVEL